ncbi:hypothetical protein [Amycolatopsis jiangsuensis]|uniref:Preprotein translocase subunit SecG n=1 Tax=Amycolatopsis jiangsuensis TaxID=1181879 RepID=A0A840IY02_9PSEU|nr:hypothetical protein [Amycolatopsis jiangsuensis]MBB4686730.1 preprotein translocase subunit SecG [Amycolatopsis jiangsuensis]
MSETSYQPGPWPSTAAPPRRQPSVVNWLPSVLLIVAGALTIVSTFLVLTRTTDRLLSDGAYFNDAHSKVSVTTTTAWSMTFSVPIESWNHPLDGWGLVPAAAFAVLVAIVLLAGRGQWTWTSPLVTLASGGLIGALLMSTMGFTELMSAAGAKDEEIVTVSAGPAIWLQMPAAVLAIAAVVLALLPRRADPANAYARVVGGPAAFPAAVSGPGPFPGGLAGPGPSPDSTGGRAPLPGAASGPAPAPGGPGGYFPPESFPGVPSPSSDAPGNPHPAHGQPPPLPPRT